MWRKVRILGSLWVLFPLTYYLSHLYKTWPSSSSSTWVYGVVKELRVWQLISAMSRSCLGLRECLCCGCTGGGVGAMEPEKQRSAVQKYLWWLQQGFSLEQLPECSCLITCLGPTVVLGWASFRLPLLRDLCILLHCAEQLWLLPCIRYPLFRGQWLHQEEEARRFCTQAETKTVMYNHRVKVSQNG